jgi:hypothetical protein
MKDVSFNYYIYIFQVFLKQNIMHGGHVCPPVCPSARYLASASEPTDLKFDIGTSTKNCRIFAILAFHKAVSEMFYVVR